jgi:hypothetical protein
MSAVTAKLTSATLFGFSLLIGACAYSPDRLPRLDRQFYYNLEDQKDQDAFLRLKEAERQAFLEKKGLWQQWTSLSVEEREAVKTQEVKVGSKAFAAHMAWGPPADVQGAHARGRSVEHETYIRCTSGPRAGDFVRNNLECDGTSSEIQLAIENNIVTELKYLD